MIFRNSISLFNPDPGCDNLYRLLFLRNIAGIVQILIIIIATRVLLIRLPIIPLLSIISFMAAVNFITWFRLSARRNCGELEFLLQLLLDITSFSFIIYFSGGASNPFVGLYILYITISAIVKNPISTWFITLYSISWYTLLMFYYIPIISPDIKLIFGMDPMVMGMWFRFVINTLFVSYFVLGMGLSIRDRDRIIVKRREEELNNQHLATLGLFASGTAHELATPLASLNLLVDSLKSSRELCISKDALNDINLMKSQIDRCRSLLDQILLSSGNKFAQSGIKTTVNDYLEKIINSFSNYRSNIVFDYEITTSHDNPTIFEDHMLIQAIVALLNNAADASPDYVHIDASWNHRIIKIRIIDHGAGIPNKVIGNLDRKGLTTKLDGHGLGLYLANSAIKRLDGHLNISRISPRGTQIMIEIPLSSIMITQQTDLSVY